jgi:hypothetical protein
MAGSKNSKEDRGYSATARLDNATKEESQGFVDACKAWKRENAPDAIGTSVDGKKGSLPPAEDL